MQIDINFLPAYAAAFILMFARIGTMVMLLPALGEMSVPVRIRLVTALLLTMVLFPLHRSAFHIDLRSFELRARPVAPLEGLRPGMSALIQLDR